MRAARVVSRGRDFNTLPNRTFVPFVSVAQNVCCLSLFREMVRLSQLTVLGADVRALRRNAKIDVYVLYTFETGKGRRKRPQEKLSEHIAVVCVQGQSETACRSSIYVHAVLTWARTLRPGEVNAACNGCVPMNQIGFDWLTGGV